MKTSHIMLIDDNEIDNYISHHIVVKSGITDKVTLMDSAVDALLFLENVKNDYSQFPDLIFVDISMPVMDGFGFIEQVVKFPKVIENSCNIVILTSSNNINDVERAAQYNVVKEYFIKPLKTDMLDVLLRKETI